MLPTHCGLVDLSDVRSLEVSNPATKPLDIHEEGSVFSSADLDIILPSDLLEKRLTAKTEVDS